MKLDKHLRKTDTENIMRGRKVIIFNVILWNMIGGGVVTYGVIKLLEVMNKGLLNSSTLLLSLFLIGWGFFLPVVFTVAGLNKYLKDKI